MDNLTHAVGHLVKNLVEEALRSPRGKEALLKVLRVAVDDLPPAYRGLATLALNEYSAKTAADSTAGAGTAGTAAADGHDYTTGPPPKG